MAVYDRHYQAFEGKRATGWRRRMVIPRYAYEEAFASRRFLMMYAACFLQSLFTLLIIFLHNNLRALTMMSIDPSEFIRITPAFFQAVTTAQCAFAFLLALILGPTLISSDLAHNALPLYLSRPIRRRDYMFGKVLVVFVLMSTVTWVAGLVLFGLEAAFAGPVWWQMYGYTAFAILFAGVGWSLLLSMLAVALSAWLKWKPVAAGALLALFIIPTGFAAVVNELFGSTAGYLLSPTRCAQILSDALFRQPPDQYTNLLGVQDAPPAWAAMLSLFALIGFSLLLLQRRLHAYEVVT